MTKHLTEAQVSERLSVARSTLRAWRQEQRGPRWRKFEGLVRYPEDWLTEYEERSAA